MSPGQSLGSFQRQSMEEAIKILCQKETELFPNGVPWKFSYGTAGFRDRAERLDRVLLRVGIVATLRSKVMNGATVGIVVTASHNPVQDNGVKFVDPSGDMMVPKWEDYATRVANAETSALPALVSEIVEANGIVTSQSAAVAFAKDTRPSGDHLLSLLVQSLTVLGATYTDFGLKTTPQLHYIIRCINTNGAFGEPTEDGYYAKMAKAFRKLTVELPPSKVTVKLDGANGVGADKVKRLMSHLGSEVITIQVCNDGSGVLNKGCGADHVKALQRAPEGMDFAPGERCVSFDGDADRIVYFYKNDSDKFFMLDGDKIAALAAGFVSEKLKLLQSDLSIGVVQTSYANGSATEYIRSTLGIPVACTATGVKHLHHKAVEFDVGVYFEANGHGTVVFSQRAIETFQKAAEDSLLSEEGRRAAEQLLALTELINQTVGDAISDLLMVEVILLHRQWSCSDWSAIYTELPNRNLKVKVQDRMKVQTADCERRCVAPEGLQEEINRLVAQVARGRSFVRPSGTEDVVRVYAEATTQEAADTLAVQVGRKVYELAQGVGEIPSLPNTAV